MNKVLTLAAAMLVLIVGTAFAETPATTVAEDTSSVDSWGLERLSDADMVAVMGEGWSWAACTLSYKANGYLLYGAATLAGNPIMQGIGLGLVAAAGAICA